MMSKSLSIEFVTKYDDFFKIAQMKKAEESEYFGKSISEMKALEKIMHLKNEDSNFWIAKIKIAEKKFLPVGYASGISNCESYLSQGIYVVPSLRVTGLGSVLEQAQIEFAQRINCNTFGCGSEVYFAALSLRE